MNIEDKQDIIDHLLSIGLYGVQWDFSVYCDDSFIYEIVCDGILYNLCIISDRPDFKKKETPKDLLESNYNVDYCNLSHYNYLGTLLTFEILPIDPINN